jgi:L-ribulose-5-phosphate 3-epimerase
MKEAQGSVAPAGRELGVTSRLELPVGIYEKALLSSLSWEERLVLVKDLGYDYLEIAIDESDRRLSRLSWNTSQRQALRTLCHSSGVRIQTMCLSAHRKYPLGSADPDVRARAWQIMRGALRFAVDVGIGMVQVAGYDVFYEPSTPDSQARFLEGLAQSARWAAGAGVMLGLENVDTELVDSVTKAMHYVQEIDSPWLQLVADMGNLAAAGYDPAAELRRGRGHLVGIHVKDTLLGVYRGVPFEQGIVPFDRAFDALSEIGFRGSLTVEMWSDMQLADTQPDLDPLRAVADARRLVDRLVAAAWNKGDVG